MASLECTTGTSSKFWKIELDSDGISTTANYGKIGSVGVTLRKHHGDSETAAAYIAAQVKAKTKNGYVDVSQAKSAPLAVHISSLPAATRLECTTGSSNKFWEISLEPDGITTNVVYGKIGTGGVNMRKVHGDNQAAQKYITTQLASKRKKGYNDVPCGSAVPPNTDTKSTGVKRGSSSSDAFDPKSSLIALGIPKTVATNLAKTLLDEGFDSPSTMSLLSDEDLTEWGVARGHKRLILAAKWDEEEVPVSKRKKVEVVEETQTTEEEEGDDSDDNDTSAASRPINIGAVPNDTPITANLEGMTFCLSGAMSATRPNIEKFLKAHGACTTSTVTKRTTHLLTTERNTAKVKKAQSQGVEIVDEPWVVEQVLEDV